MALRTAPSLLQQLRSVLAACTAEAAAAGTRSVGSDAAHAAASATAGSRLPADGLTLQHFVSQGRSPHADLVQSPASTSGAAATAAAATATSGSQQQQRTAFIETYGCQMNLSDSEVVLAVLAQAGFTQTLDPAAASVVLLNTCAIRENAEAKVEAASACSCAQRWARAHRTVLHRGWSWRAPAAAVQSWHRLG